MGIDRLGHWSRLRNSARRSEPENDPHHGRRLSSIDRQRDRKYGPLWGESAWRLLLPWRPRPQRVGPRDVRFAYRMFGVETFLRKILKHACLWEVRLVKNC